MKLLLHRVVVSPVLAQLVEGTVLGHRHAIGFQVANLVRPLHRFPHLEQHILHHVLGICRLPQHAEGEARHDGRHPDQRW